MKCITKGSVVRRVSGKEAEHYINHEGWSYCNKKIPVKGFVCSKCGKKYRTKPEKCNGVVVSVIERKDGTTEKKTRTCESKSFNEQTILVPTWR